MSAELAWPTGDRPGPLAFGHVTPPAIADAVLQAVAAAVPRAAGSLRALQPAKNPVGRYLLETPEGDFFVRVSSRHGDPELEARLVAWLEAAGVPVNRLVAAGLPLHWQGQTLRVDVRPFLAGRHVDGSDDDLAAVARSLGACHEALAAFPEAATVRANAAARALRMAKARDALASALADPTVDIGLPACWMGRHRGWLSEMVTGFRADMAARDAAVCLHGEVHQGNVIMMGGEAVLVDFEEAVHVFAPPAWDQAYLVTRFCLHDDDAFARRIGIAEAAYGRPFGAVAAAIQEVSHACIALLVDGWLRDGTPAPLSEADKFVRLHALAARLDHLARHG